MFGLGFEVENWIWVLCKFVNGVLGGVLWFAFFLDLRFEFWGWFLFWFSGGLELGLGFWFGFGLGVWIYDF